MLQFVCDIIDLVDTSPNVTRIGVMTFSYRPKPQITLTMYEDEDERLKYSVRHIRQQTGGTNTFFALDTMRSYMFASRSIRPWAPQVSSISYGR